MQGGQFRLYFKTNIGNEYTDNNSSAKFEVKMLILNRMTKWKGGIEDTKTNLLMKVSWINSCTQ